MKDSELWLWLEENKRGLECHYDEDLSTTVWWVEETYGFRQYSVSPREAVELAIKASR